MAEGVFYITYLPFALATIVFFIIILTLCGFFSSKKRPQQNDGVGSKASNGNSGAVHVESSLLPADRSSTLSRTLPPPPDGSISADQSRSPRGVESPYETVDSPAHMISTSGARNSQLDQASQYYPSNVDPHYEFLPKSESILNDADLSGYSRIDGRLLPAMNREDSMISDATGLYETVGRKSSVDIPDSSLFVGGDSSDYDEIREVGNQSASRDANVRRREIESAYARVQRPTTTQAAPLYATVKKKSDRYSTGGMDDPPRSSIVSSIVSHRATLQRKRDEFFREPTSSTSSEPPYSTIREVLLSTQTTVVDESSFTNASLGSESAPYHKLIIQSAADSRQSRSMDPPYSQIGGESDQESDELRPRSDHLYDQIDAIHDGDEGSSSSSLSEQGHDDGTRL